MLGLLLGASTSLASQSFKGRVVDITDNKALPGANVTLHNKKDSSLVAGKLTDKTGNYSFEGIKDGSYYLKVTFVGYTSKYLDLAMNSSKEELALIRLSPGAAMLDNVLVEAEKAPIQYSGGKTVVNIDKNIVSNGGNALDVLRNTPAVEVNAEGEIKLRGSANFRILIDGKKPGGDGSSPSTILKQISATNLENIEIITNPSAKYEAEGGAGIINLVTKRAKRDEGLNGLLTLNSATTDRYTGSANFNYRKDFYNAFFNYDYQKEYNFIAQNLNRDVYANSNTLSQKVANTSRHTHNMHNFKIGTDLFIDDYNSITLFANGRYVDINQNSDMLYNNYTNNIQSDRVFRNLIIQQPNNAWDYSFNYTKSTDNKGEVLTFDALVSTWSTDQDNDFTQKQYTDLNSPKPPNVVNQNNLVIADMRYINVKTDYVLPLNNSSKFEAGMQAEFNQFELDSKLYNSFNLEPKPSDWVFDSSFSTRYKNNMDVYAAYIQYSDNIIGLDYQIGLRGEYCDNRNNFQSIGIKKNQDYFDLFPNAVISYALDNTNQIQLSYSRRISRPNIYLMNPGKQSKDPYNIVMGNPDLKPEFTDSFELGYIGTFGKHTITPQLFYKKSIDNVFMTMTPSADGKILYLTYANDSDGEFYGTDLSYQGQMLQGWTMNANFSYYKQIQNVHSKSGSYSSSDYSWNGRLSTSYFILSNLMAQISAVYMPDVVTPLGKRYGYKYMDFAVKYDFWDRNASLTFRTTDLFESLTYGGFAKGNNYSFTNKYNPDSRHFSLTFSYKINNYIRKPAKPGTGTQMPSGGEFM